MPLLISVCTFPELLMTPAPSNSKLLPAVSIVKALPPGLKVIWETEVLSLSVTVVFVEVWKIAGEVEPLGATPESQFESVFQSFVSGLASQMGSRAGPALASGTVAKKIGAPKRTAETARTRGR